jgi:large subunit ribosomal protein L21
MFAVLKTGGKQYRVASGDVLRVELLAAEAGEKVQFNDILMVNATVGTPFVAGAAVQAEVIDNIKADKVITFHKRRRKHSSQRTRGHRQKLTLLRVTDILESGADKTGVKLATGTALARVEAHGTKGEAAKPAKAAPKAEKKAAAPKPEKAEKKAAAPKAEKKAEGKEAVGTRPANLLKKARDGQPDDLKLISGVGPKLEELLHQNGVYHFDQIAAWNSDEIAYMDDQLSFKGRIERDGWLDQASKFAAEKE